MKEFFNSIHKTLFRPQTRKEVVAERTEWARQQYFKKAQSYKRAVDNK